MVGEEFGLRKGKSGFTWVIDPIDGTRSFVIGNPTWSNLISLNLNGVPQVGLANFPRLNKYYLNTYFYRCLCSGKKEKNKLLVNKKSILKILNYLSISWVPFNKQTKKNSKSIKAYAISLL